MNADQVAGLINVLGIYVIAGMQVIFGYKLLMKPEKKESILIKYGNLEVTLNSAIGCSLIVASVGILLFQIKNFYP